MNGKALREKIRKRRRDLGFTQEQLAERINVSRGYISSVECGNKSMTIDTLARLANALKTTPDELLKEDLEHYGRAAGLPCAERIERLPRDKRIYILKLIEMTVEHEEGSCS